MEENDRLFGIVEYVYKMPSINEELGVWLRIRNRRQDLLPLIESTVAHQSDLT